MSGSEVFAWRLRASSDADFEWAFELHREALGSYVEQTWGWDETVQRRMFADAFGRQARQVIQVDGQDAGVLVVEERPDELFLGLLELLPAWQNRGVGTDILRWLLRQASDMGKPLSLQVLRANAGAASLYEREGLRVIDSDEIRLWMRTVA
jgi:GNAT superfamily N-acetyltransferase